MHEMQMQILMTIVRRLHSAEVTVELSRFNVVNPSTSINWIKKEECHRRQYKRSDSREG